MQKKSRADPKKQKLGCFLSAYTEESIIHLYVKWSFYSPVYCTGDWFIQGNDTAQSAHSAMHCIDD